MAVSGLFQSKGVQTRIYFKKRAKPSQAAEPSARFDWRGPPELGNVYVRGGGGRHRHEAHGFSRSM
jgi:hypothetical protein